MNISIFENPNFRDSKGFVRLKNVPGFYKFLKSISNKDIYTPSDIEKAIYKAPGKTIASDKTYDFIVKSAYQKYVDRVIVPYILKLYTCKWVMMSEFDKDNHKRKSTYMMIVSVEGIHLFSGSGRYLRIKYINLYGEILTKDIDVIDLESLVIRVVNEDEHNSLSKILTARFECKPEPYIKLFKIDSRYKDNYKLYKEDCVKYGFKIQPKSLIKKILESNEYMCVGENGFAAYENDDTYIVND